jgi:UDP-glucose 4-epimerase
LSRVVVTGAGGFVGRILCERLIADGHHVLAIVRNRALPDDLAGRLRIRRVGDLGELARDPEGVAGADVVYHLAARVHRIAESGAEAEALYVAENVEATRVLAQCAVDNGVRRLVFLSSVKALGERSPAGPLRPDAVPAPEDAYGRSKLAAERALAELHGRTGLSVDVVRSPLVYGPGVAANFQQLVKWVARGVPLPFGAIRNRRSIVSVWNLVDFLVRAASTPSSYRQLHVADERSVSTPELVRLIARGLGTSSRLVPVPPAFLEVALRAVGRGALVDRLAGSLELETDGSARELAWVPPLSTELAISRTVEGMR